MTQVIFIDPQHPDPSLVQAAAQIISAGGLVVFPTETVYALGANCFDSAALQKVFTAKQRPTTDPLIVHIADFAELTKIARDIPAEALALMQQVWPGPLTLILKKHPSLPELVSGGKGTVAVRMPAHPVTLAIIRAAGVPIVGPSANLFSHPSPTQAAHVLADLAGRVDMIVDSGPTTFGVESSVVDMTQTPPQLLRPGSFTLEALQALLPSVTYAPVYLESTTVATSPGTLLKHYSPKAQMVVFSGATERVLAHLQAQAQANRALGKKIGLLLTSQDQPYFANSPDEVFILGASLEEVAHNLFAGLRHLDALGVDLILTHDFQKEGLGLAIHDRLVRAAEGQLIRVDA